jgi:hypothetical protein
MNGTEEGVDRAVIVRFVPGAAGGPRQPTTED